MYQGWVHSNKACNVRGDLEKRCQYVTSDDNVNRKTELDDTVQSSTNKY
jgi:hypothetical protein